MLQARWRLLFVLTLSWQALAGDQPAPAVETNGTVHSPGLTIPFSPFASDEARERMVDRARHPLPVTPGDIVKTRRDIERVFEQPLLQALRRRFAVTVTAQHFGGVAADVVVPDGGVAARNRSRVLINLHGGGFSVGAGSGGQIESIPIASLGQIKVVSVDYRQGPEHRFPSASEDVAAVYAELLKSYAPRDVGIYGCSAGGILTAEALAWFEAHHLPAPGAAGIFSAGASAGLAGDSAFIGPLLSGGAQPPVPLPVNPFSAYFTPENLQDALASPVLDAAVLAKFPPVLILTGTRDSFMSSAVRTHTLLINAGVRADLHVWEGMGHCFFYYPELPESLEAWKVIVRFFEQQLGRRS